MATSLNNMLDGSQLYPGYEFLVTVDTYSENVVLVTGFIGSRKYRGALLSIPSSTIRSCTSDNVFNSDFSAKHSYSLANMAITDFYSHKKLSSDVTMFAVNKCAKEPYICANCKMKINYYTKRESKSPPPGSFRRESRSDITVLKQTLSYPDDPIAPLNPFVTKQPISLSINCPEKAVRSLKRRKEHTNHVVTDKKLRVTSMELRTREGDEKKIEDNVAPVCVVDKSLSPDIKYHQPLRREERDKKMRTGSPEKTDGLKIGADKGKENKIEKLENIDNLERETNLEKNPERDGKSDIIIETESTPDSIIVQDYKLEVNVELKITPNENTHIAEENTPVTDIKRENSSENIDEPEDTNGSLNYDDYRSMPLSLLKLNHVTLIDNDRVSDDCLNRECAKPKKIWMKMIENEDIEKRNDPPSLETSTPPVTNSKPITHPNRSYKIKQTLHDKVILTVDKRPDKRPDKHKHVTSSEPIRDVYTFSDEMDTITNAAHEPTLTNHDTPVMRQHEELSVESSQELVHEDSIKSSQSSGSKSSRKVSRKKMLLNEVRLKLEGKNGSKATRHMGKVIVKMDPDSTTDGHRQYRDDATVESGIKSCENSVGTTFNLNDIVWAKITGYPFWPAKIISFSRHEEDDTTLTGCIEWYAWNEISFIKINNLYHFNTHFATKYQKRNRNGKYQEAVKLAKFDCGMLDQDVPNSKVASSEDNGNTSSLKGSDSDSESNAASYTSASL